MKLGWKLLLVLSLGLNAGILGVGIVRSIAAEQRAEATLDLDAPLSDAQGAARAPAIDREFAESDSQEAHESDRAADRRAFRRPSRGRSLGRSFVATPGGARLAAPWWAPGNWPDRHVRRLDRWIGLSHTQRATLRGQLMAVRPEMSAVNLRLASERGTLLELLAARQLDAAAIRAQRARVSELQAQLDSLVTEVMLREASLLDPRQRHTQTRILHALALARSSEPLWVPAGAPDPSAQGERP